MKYRVAVVRSGKTDEFHTDRWQDVMAIARFCHFPIEREGMAKDSRRLRSRRDTLVTIAWWMEHGRLEITNCEKIGKDGAVTLGTTNPCDYGF